VRLRAERQVALGVLLIPVVASVLAVAVMIFYPLTDKRHAIIVAEITARRAGRNRPAAHRPVALDSVLPAYRPGNTPPPVD
jgi:glucuronide carrier protein